MKLAIGLITYKAIRYLPYFFDSLNKQLYRNYKVFVLDNSEQIENQHKKFFLQYPDVDFEWSGGNIGFSKAYNKLIDKTKKINAKYFLALNSDMILDSNSIAIMIDEMEKNQFLGSISPKILKWDFEKKLKTKMIDSCGIQLKKGLRFVDLGQGQYDNNQYDSAEILGPSGAAAMYRISALEKIRKKDKYFDELMFMYKEDCDLAYRLHLAGFKSKCVGESIIYHDRTASSIGENDLQVALNRKNKSQQIKEWSFLNQHIIFKKYWSTQTIINKMHILLYEIKMFIYVLLFERYLFKQYIHLRKIKDKINYYL